MVLCREQLIACLDHLPKHARLTHLHMYLLVSEEELLWLHLLTLFFSHRTMSCTNHNQTILYYNELGNDITYISKELLCNARNQCTPGPTGVKFSLTNLLEYLVNGYLSN